MRREVYTCCPTLHFVDRFGGEPSKSKRVFGVRVFEILNDNIIYSIMHEGKKFSFCFCNIVKSLLKVYARSMLCFWKSAFDVHQNSTFSFVTLVSRARLSFQSALVQNQKWSETSDIYPSLPLHLLLFPPKKKTAISSFAKTMQTFFATFQFSFPKPKSSKSPCCDKANCVSA